MQGFLTNLVIFIVMGIGWYLKRCGKLTPAGLKDLNGLLFSLFIPVGLFSAGIGFKAENLRGWRVACVFWGAYVIATAVAWILSGLRTSDPKRRAVSVMASVRANSIFIGLPVMTLWMGEVGTQSQLIYLAICMPYFNIVPILLSQIALNGTASRSSVVKSVLNTLKNPVLVAGLSGIAIGAFGLSPMIPRWFLRTVNVIGSCGNGLALLVIGAALMPENLLSDVKVAWPDMLMKLFIHPAVMMTMLLLFPIGNVMLSRVAVVASSISPAFNCFVFAHGFGMDEDYAAVLVASSTLICMLTMLFWMEVVVRVFV